MQPWQNDVSSEDGLASSDDQTSTIILAWRWPMMAHIVGWFQKINPTVPPKKNGKMGGFISQYPHVLLVIPHYYCCLDPSLFVAWFLFIKHIMSCPILLLFLVKCPSLLPHGLGHGRGSTHHGLHHAAEAAQKTPRAPAESQGWTGAIIIIINNNIIILIVRVIFLKLGWRLKSFTDSLCNIMYWISCYMFALFWMCIYVDDYLCMWQKCTCI